MIESFGILNTGMERDSPWYGFSYAGYYLIAPDGVVRSKFFNDLNADRTTSAGILVREFDLPVGGRQGEATTRHLALSWSASNATLRPGQRALLEVEIELRPGMHLYAPGDHSYLSLKWTAPAVAGVEIPAPVLPEPDLKHLPAIDETVPVYSGSVRLLRDIHVLGGREFPEELSGRERIEVTGIFHYQACDANRCYLPAEIPMTWSFALEPHDHERVPEALRRTTDD